MSPREIVVIDDSGRFPLHVWRYLTGSLGFGIGDVGVDGCRTEPHEVWIEEEPPILSEDGCHRLWWVPADEMALNRLEGIFSRFEPQSRIYALVDVHGKRGYRVQDACAYLEGKRQRFSGCEIHLVSAYHSGHRIGKEKAHEVLPKSRETLRRMIRDLGIDSKAMTATPGVRHVLVTGAGFEIRGKHGGFGMPPTHQILWEMEAPFYRSPGPPGSPADLELGPVVDPAKKKGSSDDPEWAFPIPTNGLWATSWQGTVLSDFAAKGNLDNYWDFLLEEELRSRLGHPTGLVTAQQRDENKARAVWRERRLREAFRRSLLHHDWGFMNQSLDAARLPLHAWLTTNYTHFANRAISLCGDAEKELGMWRILSTAAEARTLAREDAGAPDQEVRYLFKLHGDIAHLQTMAIAGHDKDLFSPLAMPVEDLYEVYAAAERFLVESLRNPETSLVVWHVVGHGLQDRRLCDLLVRACRHIEAEQVFVLVNPQYKTPEDILRPRLEELRMKSEPPIYVCTLKAAEYMARLRRLFQGEDEELREVRRPEDLKRWLAAADPSSSNPSLY